LLEREYLQNATDRGRQLLAGLSRLAEQDAELADPRGLGLMAAIDLHGRAGLDPERRDAIIEAAFHRGLLLLACGKAGIRFCPSLCVSAEQVEAALEIFVAAVSDVREA
jgi:4-aminobutyrate aminotransferase